MVEETREAYLKCNYYQGMFSGEYFVDFKGSMKRGTSLGGDIVVMKEKILVKDETSGLVPIIIASRKEKTSNILIDGAVDVGAGVFFSVPNEEIIFDKN
jgi:hypothetical protein